MRTHKFPQTPCVVFPYYVHCQGHNRQHDLAKTCHTLVKCAVQDHLPKLPRNENYNNDLCGVKFGRCDATLFNFANVPAGIVCAVTFSFFPPHKLNDAAAALNDEQTYGWKKKKRRKLVQMLTRLDWNLCIFMRC